MYSEMKGASHWPKAEEDTMANKATHMDACDVMEEKNDFMVRIVNVMKRGQTSLRN